MAANTNPIFPVAPLLGAASLIAPNAVATRINVPVAGLNAATYFALTQPTTNGARIDNITVATQGSCNAGALDIWISDGTTLRYFTTIDIAATVASTTADPFTMSKQFANLVLPPAYQLYASATVQQNINVFAFGGSY